MSKEKRQAKISSVHDRLCEQKLMLVYHLLVPANVTNNISDNNLSVELINETVNENSSYLYESIIGPTKGR